jgi:hypothetical protein
MIFVGDNHLKFVKVSKSGIKNDHEIRESHEEKSRECMFINKEIENESA